MEATGFRCPNCGQAHIMHIDEHEVKMNEEMTVLIVDGVELEKGQKIDLAEDKQLVCFECCHDFLSVSWIQAFTDPLVFFEMEQLCHCGGELWMDQIPGTQTYGFVCEKCLWVKPNQKVSGA